MNRQDLRSLHLEVVIRSLPMKVVKQIKCGPLHLEAVIKSLVVKAIKTIGSLYFGGSWPAESLNLETRGSPCKLVLCDDGHELSSFQIRTHGQ